MNDNELMTLREALRYLPFCGISIKDFARGINVNPHTLYNYIGGQRPSEKHFNYIVYALERDYPKALLEGKLIADNRGTRKNGR